MFNNNTLSITITNNTTIAKPWVAFGYNQNSQNLPGVMVAISQSSLKQATTESAQIPFKIESIKVKTSNERQLNNPIQIQTTDATGQFQEYKIIPLDYYEPTNSIKNLVKINNPNIIISGQVSLQGVINPAETMNIIIKIQKPSTFSNFVSNVLNKISNTTWNVKWRLIPE